MMALPIWAGLMSKVVAAVGDEPFARPAGVVDRLICARTGLLARARCDSVRAEVFLAGHAPDRGCDRHGGTLLEYRAVPATPAPIDETDAEAGPDEPIEPH